MTLSEIIPQMHKEAKFEPFSHITNYEGNFHNHICDRFHP